MFKLSVAVLGARGAAGLEFVRPLSQHPKFEIAALYGDQSAGKTLEEACLPEDLEGIPASVRQIKIQSSTDISSEYEVICSALPTDTPQKKQRTRQIEEECARHTLVVSTTSVFRYEADSTAFITEVNGNHLRIVDSQRQQRGWEGGIVPGPNCTATGLAIALYPLHREVGIERVIVSSYQAVSGGGRALIEQWRQERKALFDQGQILPYPLAATDHPVDNPEPRVEGNLIEIPGEKEKVLRETRRILGRYAEGRINSALFLMDGNFYRVPVLQGHSLSAVVETTHPYSAEMVRYFYARFNDNCRRQFGHLPSSPPETIVVLDRKPQPLFDANLYRGMATVVRVQESPAFAHGINLEILSHNLAKGAALGMVQMMEHMLDTGFLHSKSA